MAFEQFLGSFEPQPLTLSGLTQLQPPGAPAPQPAMNVGGGTAPQSSMQQFLATLMQSLSQPQTQQGGGMGDIAALVKALRPGHGEILGDVAASNSRPSGFTPQAAWDAWGPGARKATPTSDARLGLKMGGGEDPRLAAAQQPNPAYLGAPAAPATAGGQSPQAAPNFDFFGPSLPPEGPQLPPTGGAPQMRGTAPQLRPAPQAAPAAQGSQDTTGNVGAPWLDFLRMFRPGII